MTFKIVPSKIKEPVPGARVLSIPRFAVSVALRKARDVQKRYPGFLILGADTVVVLGKQVMGKPANAKEAAAMLRRLSGKTHAVVTGIALLDKNKSKTAWCRTKVKFRKLSSRFIRDYVKTGEPMDKAGAYGIQGLGALCVERIDGDYFNVVGLPLVKSSRLLRGSRGGLDFLAILG